jgi:dTDP-4-dehydrorhamnose reductase
MVSPMTRPILLFGATSIVGFNIVRSFPNEVLPFITPGNRAPAIRGWPILNLEDRGWPESIFREHRPKILLYCHAVCDVPKCQAAPEWAWEINVGHVRRVLGVLPQETRLVYVSSDHVFGGDGIYDEYSAPALSAFTAVRVSKQKSWYSRDLAHWWFAWVCRSASRPMVARVMGLAAL